MDNMMFSRSKALLFVSLVLSACSPKPVNSIDRLILSSSNDGIYARPANLKYPLQTRFLATNGKIPVPTTGSACLASSYRPANSMICFSHTGGTNVLKKHYAFEGSPSELDAAMAAVKTSLTAATKDLVTIGTASAAAAAEEGQPISQETLAEVEQARASLAANLKKVSTTLNQKNIFVFRWNSENKANADGAIASLFSARGATSQASSGIVIVGGLTVSQLLLGVNDFDTEYRGVPDNAKIATLTLSADRLEYFADSSIAAIIEASLTGTPTELKAARDLLGMDGQIVVNAALQLASAAENQGSFSEPQSSYHSPREPGAPDDQIFFATMTDLKTLRRALK